MAGHDQFADLLANALFDGAYRATGYILGPQQLKAFARSFAEASLEKILEKTGKKITGQNALAALESWGKAETEIGLHSGQHTEITSSEDGAEVTYSDCMFAESCGSILADLIMQSVVDKEELPCMRCSLSIAAIHKATGEKSKYKMVQHAPGFRCRCSIHLL